MDLFFFREGGRTMETMAKRKIAALNSILISVLIFLFSGVYTEGDGGPHIHRKKLGG